MTSTSLVIDFHVHALEPEVFKRSTNKTVFTGFGAHPVAEPRPGAKALMDRMFHPELIIEDMDARGIDMSVVTSSTVLQVLLGLMRSWIMRCASAVTIKLRLGCRCIP